MHRRTIHRAAIIASASLALIVGWSSAAAAAAPAKSRPGAKVEAGPGVKSLSALIVDGNTGQVIYERDTKMVTPIASVTKLMTALVVLDALQPLDEVITLTSDDKWKGKGAFSRIPIGAKISRGDLMRLALMASENRAARTLARNYPGGIPEFVKTMNIKAKALGMTQTQFDDPSGLSSNNVSSARDLVKLVNAVSRQSIIRDYSTLPSYEVRAGKSMLGFRNTNLLIGRDDWDIVVQKTGFTQDAGECLVMQAMIDERPVTMVFLNSFGKLTRTADARRVRKWMQARDAEKRGAGGEVAKK
jgi:D-alanyl-D-alanine endopeptidase (penicillin-binding protein 7)